MVEKQLKYLMTEYTLWAKNFIEITLSRKFSEINVCSALYAEIQEGRPK